MNIWKMELPGQVLNRRMQHILTITKTSPLTQYFHQSMRLAYIQIRSYSLVGLILHRLG